MISGSIAAATWSKNQMNAKKTVEELGQSRQVEFQMSEINKG